MSLDTDLHLAATEQFIAANPTDVSIVRPTVTSDGAGGTVQSGSSTLPSQTVRIVALNLRTSTEARVTTDGQTVTANFAVIAMPDADIEVGDQFTDGGKKFEVLVVKSRPEWRKRAEVFRHA